MVEPEPERLAVEFLLATLLELLRRIELVLEELFDNVRLEVLLYLDDVPLLLLKLFEFVATLDLLLIDLLPLNRPPLLELIREIVLNLDAPKTAPPRNPKLLKPP
jgi:hypothetical protein